MTHLASDATVDAAMRDLGKHLAGQPAPAIAAIVIVWADGTTTTAAPGSGRHQAR